MCYNKTEHTFFERMNTMPKNDLQKKIESIDKKLKSVQLPRGEGSIGWKRKESCYLTYRKPIQYPDGSSERISVYAYDIPPLFVLMKEEEEKRLDKWKLNHMNQVANTKNEDDILLSEAITHWFYKKNYLNKRGRTYDREESTLNNQILKYTNFVHTEMRIMNDTMIQDHIKVLMKKYSYSTVKKTYELLDQFFRYYYSRDLNNNPMNTVGKPKEKDVKRVSSYKPKEIRYFTPEEIKKFTQEALLTWSTGKSKYKFGAGLLLIMYTGLRSGEALASRWKNIDFDNCYLAVEEAESHEKVRDENMQPTGVTKKFADDPKTKAGVRNVYLIKQAIDYAKKLKDLQKPLTDEEYIFATSQGAPAVSYYNLYRAFNLICKNSGIKDVDEAIGLHALRHTFISMLCRKGVDKLIVARIVGQSDTEMIEKIYYHVMQTEKDAAVKKIELSNINSANDILVAKQLAGVDLENLTP